jgi:Metallo-peptidase family M12
VPTVRVNRILVGAERFTAADRQNTTDAMGVMRQIMLGIGLHVEFDFFKISVAEAGRFVHISSAADAVALTHRVQAGASGTVDMFVVRTMTGDGTGWSPVGGSCDKRDKGQTGIVVSLEGPDAAYRGNTFAHEFGHYLGLHHAACDDPALATNFIRGGPTCSSDSNTGITPDQATTMLAHCSVQP